MTVLVGNFVWLKEFSFRPIEFDRIFLSKTVTVFKIPLPWATSLHIPGSLILLNKSQLSASLNKCI